jgi:hypothetical protein
MKKLVLATLCVLGLAAFGPTDCKSVTCGLGTSPSGQCN